MCNYGMQKHNYLQNELCFYVGGKVVKLEMHVADFCYLQLDWIHLEGFYFIFLQCMWRVANHPHLWLL